MALGDVVRLADAVQGQLAPAAAGPAAFAGVPLAGGERAGGIRPLDEYVAALREVAAAPMPEDELVGRLRLAQNPGERDMPRLFVSRAAWLAAPAWYPRQTAAEVARARAFAVAASTGFVNFADPADPTALVGLGPLWRALDQVDHGVLLSVHPAGGAPGEPAAADVTSWMSALAAAWFSWHSWRAAAHGGRPLSEWGAAETAAVDPAPVRRALARRMPREVLHGAMDARVLAAEHHKHPPPAVAGLLSSYYSPLPAPSPIHVSDRHNLFLSRSSPFVPVWPGGAGNVAVLRPVARQAVRLALRYAFVLRGLAGMAAAWGDTPWARAAADLLADQFAAYLAGGPGPLGPWPDAGLGARTVGPAGTVTRLYGGFDLQFGDADATATFGGSARPGAGGLVSLLVDDLRALGFTAAAPGIAVFDSRVAMAVREFQVEAGQARIRAVRNGSPVVADQWRRYLGEVHGIVDGETRRVLQLWLGRPRVDGDPAELLEAAGLASPRNGLAVVATDETVGPAPVASAVVEADIWGPLDHPVTDRRRWAVDWLTRWPVVAAERPVLGDFGPPVPGAGVDAVPLGRYRPRQINGPATFTSDTWRSTLLTWARFQEGATADMPARQQDWRVVYGMSHPEIGGYAEAINAYDPAWLSFGWSHWTLRANGGTGELGSLLAWYRWRYPAGYQRDFRAWGVAARTWPVRRLRPGKYETPVEVLGVRPAAAPRVADRSQTRDPIGDELYLHRDWLRSWRVIYRVQQAIRHSPSFWAAMREFAVRRVWEVLATGWTGAAHFTDPATRWADIFTSERAVVALLRFHINQPGLVFANAAGAPANFLAGVVQSAVNAHRGAGGGPGAIPTASLAAVSAPATAFQAALIAAMTDENAPSQDSVDAGAAVAAVPPGGDPLSSAPGSYPGPPAAWP